MILSIAYESILANSPILQRLHAVEKAEEERNKAQRGFVIVAPKDNQNDLDPRMVGLHVTGRNSMNDRMCRHIRANGRAALWFKEAIVKEEAEQTGMMFRVRVTGLSKSKKTVYVEPLSKSFDQAVKEWERKKKEIESEPTKITDDITRVQLCKLVYTKVAKDNNMMVVEFNEESLSAWMAPIDDSMCIYYANGAHNVWDFTGGINKGVTTLEEEIDRSVKLHRVR